MNFKFSLKMSEAKALAELQQQFEKLKQQLNAKKSPVATSSGGLPESKHLDGQNYNDWKFLMKNFLIDAGLWQCIETPPGIEIDYDMDQRALAKINLSIKSIASSETKKATTAKEAWDSLRSCYEDKGVVRRIGLYSSLFRIKYSECKSMSVYIDQITSIAEQLDCIGKPLDDETVGGIILGGLPEKFRPLILGIQGSNQNTSVDFVKNLLLQENVKDLCSGSSRNESAFFGKSNQRKMSPKSKNKSSKPRCYNCNELGHFSSNCTKPRKRSNTNTNKLKNENPGKASNFLSSTSSCPFKMNDWYLDSGCNAHMTPRGDWIENISPEYNKKIDVANGNTVSAEGIGTVNIQLATNRTANVQDVIHAPDLAANLLSISQIAKKGNSVVFDSEGCRITDLKLYISKKNIIATATEDKGLYRLDTKSMIASAATLSSHDVWHRRLAHLNRKDMKLLVKWSTGMDPEPDPKLPCISCVKGKQHRKPFPKVSGHRAKNVLDLIHSDLCGPMQNKSVGGASYFLTFIDDFSRKSFVYFLKTKDEVIRVFGEFKAAVENETGRHIKVLRTDNGGEYVSSEFHKLLKAAGIRHQLTVPRTPEQNGVAERLNRTLVEKGRTMLIDANLPVELWAEAVYTANYLKNLSPTKVVPNMTPEEAWSGNKPDLSHLKIFGCKALVHVPQALRKKWDAKSEEKIFVGYSEETKGYRVIDPKTKKISIARDVIFIENESINKTDDKGISDDDTSLSKTETMVEDLPSVTVEELDTTEDKAEIQETASTDFTTDSTLSKRVPVPNRKIYNDDFIVYQANLCTVQDPQTYEEAISRPEASYWKKAIQDEIQAHLENKSWEYCELPSDRKAIKSRWTFKTKYKSNGDIEKYKARLVAKGCSQTYGIDYEETFSPTVRYNSIRLLLSLAAKFNLDIDQMDVITAFLHPVLEEEIYMELPDNELFPHRYCRLKKSIYGLKQASRAWYQKLDQSLCEMGLQRSKVDPCIYFKSDAEGIIIIAVYVDDLLILSNNEKQKKRLKTQLKKQFNMKDLGKAHFILGFEICKDSKNETISVDQSLYLKNMLKRFGMEDCKKASTPFALGQILTKDMSPKSEEERETMKKVPYREAVGCLLYASQGTRPDICHAVGIVSRFSNDPGQAHWIAVKRIFRYLRGTLDKKLLFKKSQDSLIGYADSDWANDRDDRRSTTGYIFCESGTAISWNSKKQPTVALSTTEAEYMAMSSAAQELLWLTQLRAEITGKQLDSVPLYCDNRGAIQLSCNRILSPRVKHIDIRHHFLREKVEEGLIDIQYVDSKNNAADVLTKPLPIEHFNKCISMFGLE